MSMIDEPHMRTRMFARVIGPYLIIVPGILSIRTPEIEGIFTSFFANASIVWIMGAILVLGGLTIIAFHQYWSSLAAILISLFGWFLVLRGIALLAAPQLIADGGTYALTKTLYVRLGFSILVFAGGWLTYIGWAKKRLLA